MGSLVVFFVVLAVSTVDSVYFMLLRLWPPIMKPGRSCKSLSLLSAYRLNKYRQNAHLSLTSFSIFVYLLNCFSINISTVAYQYSFWTILISSPNISTLTCSTKVYFWCKLGIWTHLKIKESVKITDPRSNRIWHPQNAKR